MNYKKTIMFCLFGLATFFTECSEKRSLKDLLNTNDVDPLEEVYGPHTRSSNIIESAPKKIKINNNSQNPILFINTPKLPIKININNSPIDNSSNSNSEIYSSNDPSIKYKKNTKLKFQKDFEDTKIILYFSSIQTDQAYQSKINEIGNEVLVRVICGYEGCDKKRNGLLSQARSDIISHRKAKHLVCKCDIKHESEYMARNCSTCINSRIRPKNNKPIYDIIIHFEKVPNKREFEKEAIGYKDTGQYIAIICDICKAHIYGKYDYVYKNMETHRSGCKRKNR